jgi:hypothetical protein
MKVKKKPRVDLDAMERAARFRKLPGFKLIIAGSRQFDAKAVKKVIRNHWKHVRKHMGCTPSWILSGDCPTGADRAGIVLAKELTGRKAIKFPANWDLLGKSAGIHRNLDMASLAHGLLLIWDGKSRGSAHMLGCMEVRDRLVYEIEID